MGEHFAKGRRMASPPVWTWTRLPGHRRLGQWEGEEGRGTVVAAAVVVIGVGAAGDVDDGVERLMVVQIVAGNHRGEEDRRGCGTMSEH